MSVSKCCGGDLIVIHGEGSSWYACGICNMPTDPRGMIVLIADKEISYADIWPKQPAKVGNLSS